MPGVPLDVMDKFKAMFKRKPKKDTVPSSSATAGTNTGTPATTGEIPTPTQIPHTDATATKTNTAAPPSSSEPVAPAGMFKITQVSQEEPEKERRPSREGSSCSSCGSSTDPPLNLSPTSEQDSSPNVIVHAPNTPYQSLSRNSPRSRRSENNSPIFWQARRAYGRLTKAK